MRFFKLFLVLAGMHLLLTSCAGRQETADSKDQGRFTQHYEESDFQITENRDFSVELLPDSGSLTTGPNTVQVIIHNRQDMDVEGAEVTATLFKVGNRQETEKSLTALERGAGIYIFEPVVQSPGHWRMQVAVAKAKTADSAVFDFPEVKPGSETDAGESDVSDHFHDQGHTHSNGHDHTHNPPSSE